MVARAFDDLWSHPQTRPLTPDWIAAYAARRRGAPLTNLAQRIVADEAPAPPPEPHAIQPPLPVLFVASLMEILGEGQLARLGKVLMGLSLILIGLDLMQAASAGLDDYVTSDWLPGDSWAGRLVMVVIGLVLVAIMQSSAPGFALTLILLGSGALSFGQAAAMVVGMNVGTTLTGFLASLGGSSEMRRAAIANLMFNFILAVLAFPLIDLLAPFLHNAVTGPDDQTALVLFHTGLNVLDAAMFLPFTRPFAALVIWLVPDRAVTLAAALDPQLLTDSGAALDAAARTATAITLDRACVAGCTGAARPAPVGRPARSGGTGPQGARDVAFAAALTARPARAAETDGRADASDRSYRPLGRAVPRAKPHRPSGRQSAIGPTCTGHCRDPCPAAKAWSGCAPVCTHPRTCLAPTARSIFARTWRQDQPCRHLSRNRRAAVAGPGRRTRV